MIRQSFVIPVLCISLLLASILTLWFIHTQYTPIEGDAIEVVNIRANKQIKELRGMLREQRDKPGLTDEEVFDNVIRIIAAIKETELERDARINLIRDAFSD